MQTIRMTQLFNASQREVFDFLSNHNNLGKILNANIERIRDAEGLDPNGLGSVRSIKLGIELVQETVTTFEAPNLIEYTITSNAPINYHLGRLEFSTPEKGKTLLTYTIDMETKIPFADSASLFVLKTIISNGLKKLASKYK